MGLKPTGCNPWASSPDRHFQLQLDVKTLLHAAAHQVDEAQRVAGGGAGVKDNRIAVALADLGAADAGAGQAGLLDQGRGAEGTRVAKHPEGRLVAERLARLALDPRPP